MRNSFWLIAAGLVLVAAAAFLIGRSSPRRPPVATPETGGPVPKSPLPTASPEAKGAPAIGEGGEPSAGPSVPPPPPIRPPVTPAPPTSIAHGTYASKELKVSVEAPKAGTWTMTDNPLQFRDPLRLPSKRLEIRHDPTDGDPRVGVIELHVLDIPADSSEIQEIVKLERPGKSAKFGTYKVIEDASITFGGLAFRRRLTSWDARNTPLARQDPRVAETKILSVSSLRDGKLYAFVAYAPADQFDSLLPEIEQAIQSLRLR